MILVDFDCNFLMASIDVVVMQKKKRITIEFVIVE